MSRREPTDAGPETGESFLDRWSRLKSGSRAHADRSHGDNAPPGPATTDATAPAAPPVELPDLSQLDQDSDYSAFLSPGVDAALRRTALRKLFHSPKFNVCDGLDDYCGDFTQFAPLDPGIVTADMRHHLERAARKAAESLDAPSESHAESHAESRPGLHTRATDDPGAATAAATSDATDAEPSTEPQAHT